MQKVNTNEIPPLKWMSPKGKFVGEGIEVSEALGRKPRSTDLRERHPFVLYVVADNPIGESYYYPDSGKWALGMPERRSMRAEPLDYYDGEE